MPVLFRLEYELALTVLTWMHNNGAVLLPDRDKVHPKTLGLLWLLNGLLASEAQLVSLLDKCSFNEIGGWNFHPLVHKRPPAYVKILPAGIQKAIRSYAVLSKRRPETDSKAMFLWVLRARRDTKPAEVFTEMLRER